MAIPFGHLADESKSGPLRLGFDRRIKLHFHGAKLVPTAGCCCFGRWKRVSRRTFASDALRLQLRARAYNLGKSLRALALPPEIAHRTLTMLREMLVTID